MAFEADLLLRSGFASNINRTIEVAQHGVVQLLNAIDLSLEVSSRAGTHMAFNTRHLRVRGMLGGDKLRFHWHMTALTAKVHLLSVLISFVTTESSQKKKHHSAERERREDTPVTFARQVDLENAMFLFDLRSTTLLTFVQDRAEKYECEAEKKEKRGDHIGEDPNVGIFSGSE